jgi:hypothetical protein
MANYTSLLSSIDKVFASSSWKNFGVKSYPANFWPATNPDEFVIYEIIPSSPPVEEYSKPTYKRGMIIIQIYTRSNKGSLRTYEIADKLADLLENQYSVDTQLSDGTLNVRGIDKDDTSLFRADYSLQFNSF